MKRSLFLIAALVATPAFAQSATDTKSFGVTGNVPPLCAGGTLTGVTSNFDLGVLIDTATGFLRTNLAAPNKLLSGSFCSARSTITVNATPMLAQNFTVTPPTGFSRTVNYTATASGWTVNPAVFTTGAGTNGAAVQERPTAFTGDITVGVSGFATGGGNTLRMVADTSYLGTVTVTLAVAKLRPAMRALPILALAAALAGPATAQSLVASRQLPVSGNAPQVCAVQAPRLAPGAQINFRGLSGNTLQVDRLVDPTTLATNAASADVQFDAVCNFPHRIRVESQNNGLWQTNQTSGAIPGGFAFAVPYRATVTWGGRHRLLNAEANVRRIAEQRFNVDQATAGQLLLRVQIEAGASNTSNNAPLLAGFYGDTLRLFLEPR